MNADKTLQSGSSNHGPPSPNAGTRLSRTCTGLTAFIGVYRRIRSLSLAALLAAGTLAVAQERPSQPEPPTIESAFGSHIMVRGFMLNNELTDFNFLPVAGGTTVTNSVAPGKRPRSSMAPFLVFDRDGLLDMVLGSPGGSLIIGYVSKVLVGVLDWGLDVQSAIDLPNFGSRNGPTEIEKGSALESTQAALKAMGHDVRAIEMTSGVQAIRRGREGWEGGADPRREGVARGR